MPDVSPPAPAGSVHQAAYIEAGGRTRYLTHGHRLLIGASPSCDIVVDGPGVAPKHARLSLRMDGRIVVRPLSGGTVRVDGRRATDTVAMAPGSGLGIGLAAFATGTVEHSVYVHLLLSLAELRAGVRRNLARVPWLLISATLHAALALVLLLMLTPVGTGHDGNHAVLSMREDTSGETLYDSILDDDIADVPEPEVPEVQPPEVVEESTPTPEEDGMEPLPGLGAERDLLAGAMLEDLARGRRAPKDGETGKDGKGRSLPEGVSPKFRETVATMRRTGLEVAFVFDSTSSMGRLLDDAKRDLREIFLTLEELVPATRMALITYRDRGDEYVTRQTRMGCGRFEALAFLSSVQPNGGGDFEEAVDDALEAAQRLPWTPGAHKIVVLVGDAPPHRSQQRACDRIAADFKRKRGQVHCLVVGKEAKTWESLGQIAKSGAGRVLPREESEKLELQILELAFGADAGHDLRTLMAENERQRAHGASRPPAASILVRNLTRNEPDALLVEAWTRASHAELGRLLPLLKDRRLSAEGLYAVYYLVNQALAQNRLPTLRPEPPSGTARGLPGELRRALAELGQPVRRR